MALRRNDFPLNSAQTAWQAGSAESVDSGQELVDLTATGIYPKGTSPGRTLNLQRDLPPRWYDVRHSRAVSVQLTSWNVTGTATIQINGSNDAVGSIPLYLFNPATGLYVNSWTVTAGGTQPTPQNTFNVTATPNSLLVLIDAPWFSWLQVQVISAGATGAGWLTIQRRD
jgi:hypothetical protein